MPNRQNIFAPITLISYGRSGTSLIHKAFEAHPNCEAVGETSNLIFSTWRACELTAGIVRSDANTRATVVRTDPQRWGAAVHCVFLTMFESDKKYWFQKPIGMPYCIDNISNYGNDMNKFYSWYWNAFTNIFPEGKVITILRHPFDVALSAIKFFGKSRDKVARDLIAMCELLTCPESRVNFAVCYEKLVDNPELELAATCAYLDIEYAPEMASACQMLHVPTPGVHIGTSEQFERKKGSHFSRRTEWNELDIDSLPDELIPQTKQLWERFGFELVF